MKIFDFFDLDVRKQNQSKFRKIKLLICSLLLIMSFTIIGYRTISLASINKKNEPTMIRRDLAGPTRTVVGIINLQDLARDLHVVHHSCTPAGGAGSSWPAGHPHHRARAV